MAKKKSSRSQSTAKAVSANRPPRRTSAPPLPRPAIRSCRWAAIRKATLRTRCETANISPPSSTPCREKKVFKLDEVVYEGFGGVLCVEAGGPAPGVGCAAEASSPRFSSSSN